MKQIIRTAIIFFIGLISASIGAYVYFNVISVEKEVRKLTPVQLTGEEEAFITAISGEVYIMRDNNIISAEVGDPLFAGDIIKVVDDSFCQVQFSDIAAAKIKSNTIVKIRNLFNLDKTADVKTEILTGSMLYRVNKLREGEKLEVKSEDRIFSVRGTVFFVDRTSDGTRLSVDEGLVSVSGPNGQNEAGQAGAGEEILLESGSEEEKLQARPPMGAYKWEESQSLTILQYEDAVSDVVKTGIRTVPDDAQIYINGILSGKGHFTGLFPKEEEIIILVRKRGYNDKVMTIKASSDLEYTVSLDPEIVGEMTLIKELEKGAADSDELSLRRELESKSERLLELEQLIISLKERNSILESSSSSSENLVRRMTERIQELEQEQTDLASEVGELQRKLDESTARENKLREVIKQISDLSSDDES